MPFTHFSTCLSLPQKTNRLKPVHPRKELQLIDEEDFKTKMTLALFLLLPCPTPTVMALCYIINICTLAYFSSSHSGYMDCVSSV